MQSPSNQSCFPSIMNSKTFDLSSTALSCDVEESFEPTVGYITPRTMSLDEQDVSLNPPRFVFRSAPVAISISDLGSIDSNLYLPEPLEEDEKEGESVTTLLPRFVSFPVIEENSPHSIDHFSLPSLEDLTHDTVMEDNESTSSSSREVDDNEQDTQAESLSSDTSTAMETAPLMPHWEKPESPCSLPNKLKMSVSTNRNIRLTALRRKSFSAYAA